MLEEFSWLIRLQKIDSQLAEIDAEKGDLPDQISKLKDEIDLIKLEINSAESELSEIEKKKQDQQRIIEEAQGRQKKSQGTLYSVKTTREYDAISTEIEQSRSQILEGERILADLESQEQDLQITMESRTDQLSEFETEQAEREIEMGERSENTQDLELELNHEREKIVVRLKKPVYAHYERIKKIRDGVGVSFLSESACSYCFSMIPPQRKTDIRRMDDLILCEVCGCILISDRLEQD